MFLEIKTNDHIQNFKSQFYQFPSDINEVNAMENNG